MIPIQVERLDHSSDWISESTLLVDHRLELGPRHAVRERRVHRLDGGVHRLVVVFYQHRALFLLLALALELLDAILLVLDGFF